MHLLRVHDSISLYAKHCYAYSDVQILLSKLPSPVHYCSSADAHGIGLLQCIVPYQHECHKTLQSVLHSAASLIMRKRKIDSITPTLRDDLHWLPVPQKIVYTNSTGARVRLLHSAFKSCACQSQSLPVIVTCAQLLGVRLVVDARSDRSLHLTQ